jgi:hypothetical protein
LPARIAARESLSPEDRRELIQAIERAAQAASEAPPAGSGQDEAERKRELEEAKRAAAQRLEEQKKSQGLKLKVTPGAAELLPYQPLPVRLEVFNGSDETQAVAAYLEPRFGFLSAEVVRPGEQEFSSFRLPYHPAGYLGIDDKNAFRIEPGSRIVLHVPVALGLGVDDRTGAAVPGAYRLRFTLGGARIPLVSDEIALTIRAPAGDDAAVFARLVAGKLGDLVGPDTQVRLRIRTNEAVQAADELRALVQAYPGCSYAADLRLGLLDFLVYPAQGLMRKTPEQRADLQRRLDEAAREAADRDAPAGWARAEVLHVRAAYSARKADWKDYRACVERFAALCPEDLRIPGLKKSLEGK